MFKLVIVEDEDHIRHSLESFIPWEKIGFQVVGAFSDGADALTYLLDNPCDVVMTDILMTRMSGLEMLQRLHKVHPQIKTVILSGHSEFTYAREAIEYGVSHYLVKPVDEDELMNVFRGLKEQLDERLEEQQVHEPPAPQPADASVCDSVSTNYRLLILELDLGSKDTLVHLLKGILYELREASCEDIQIALKDLYAVIETDYKKRKLSTWDITSGKFNYNHLYRCQTIQAFADCIIEDFCALCEGLKKQTRDSEHTVIERLVQYLNEHMDEDVGHDVLAAKYRMHPGYLSRLFKQEMGETLSEYMLRIKIEKAAGLLKEGHYKIGQIAKMVGYSTSSYFSIMFKKYTGLSPREYSQRISL